MRTNPRSHPAVATVRPQSWLAKGALTVLAALLGPAQGSAQELFRDLLVGATGDLKVPVTYYEDCRSQKAVATKTAERNRCLERHNSQTEPEYYFMGHNPGVFSSLRNAKPGDVISYWDPKGVEHRLVIVGWVDITDQKPQPKLTPQTVAQFQLCLRPKGKVTRIISAEPEPLFHDWGRFATSQTK